MTEEAKHIIYMDWTQGDQSGVPGSADILSVPANADILFVPANADILSVPANADILSVPGSADFQSAPKPSYTDFQSASKTLMPRQLSTTLLLTMFVILPALGAETLSPAADQELAAGHFKAASQLYRLALATHRFDIPTLLKASKAYEGAGDLDEAVAKARAAVLYAPENADAHLRLGHCLDVNRDESGAIIQFELVLEIKSSGEARKLAYGPLLRLLKHEGKMEKLLKVARHGVRTFPQDADTHYNLAWALSEMPKTKEKEDLKIQREAIAEYRKSIELGVKQANAHYNLAKLLAELGEKVEAQKELTKFLELAPEAADTASTKELSAKLSGVHE